MLKEAYINGAELAVVHFAEKIAKENSGINKEALVEQLKQRLGIGAPEEEEGMSGTDMALLGGAGGLGGLGGLAHGAGKYAPELADMAGRAQEGLALGGLGEDVGRAGGKLRSLGQEGLEQATKGLKHLPGAAKGLGLGAAGLGAAYGGKKLYDYLSGE